MTNAATMRANYMRFIRGLLARRRGAGAEQYAEKYTQSLPDRAHLTVPARVERPVVRRAISIR